MLHAGPRFSTPPVGDDQRMHFSDGTFVQFTQGEHEGIVGISIAVEAKQGRENLRLGDVDIELV